MATKQKKNDDWFPWALIVFFFVVDAWPVALILLFFKLFGSDEKKRRTAPPLETAGAPRTARAAAPANRAAKAVKKVTRSPAAKKSNAKLLKATGAVLAVAGIWMAVNVGLWLPELLQWLALAAAGGAMLYSGVNMDRQLKRYAKYLAVMGDREAISVEELARTLGYSERRVEKDLQRMIDKSYFGGKAYLNVELGYLLRSGQADEVLKRRQREEAARETETPREAETGYSGILRNIRRANDRIADPALSAKIDRLEDITARIFRAVEEDPKKRGRIDTFLNYYLPTTQKLLDSYAQFEAAGVEGENLRQAKSRIEATMDAIIQGFEHQLDELYKADVLDVDSDIRVMETMLRRDTASVERDFGLGTAVQEQEE